jgi:hypothetical protein
VAARDYALSELFPGEDSMLEVRLILDGNFLRMTAHLNDGTVRMAHFDATGQQIVRAPSFGAESPLTTDSVARTNDQGRPSTGTSPTVLAQVRDMPGRARTMVQVGTPYAERYRLELLHEHVAGLAGEIAGAVVYGMARAPFCWRRPGAREPWALPFESSLVTNLRNG